MAVLSELPAGHVFDPFSFTVSPEAAREYRGAVEDRLGLYDAIGAVPPLAVAALALGVLLESVLLPPGSLHANESLACQTAVPPGAALECRAVLAQRSQRSGWVVSVLDCEIRLAGHTALTARATVLSPQPPS